MTAYFIIFFSLLILALITKPYGVLLAPSLDNKLPIVIRPSNTTFFVVFIICVIFIGLRFNVGGDFGAYRYMYTLYVDDTFLQAISFRYQSTDAGFALLNWFVTLIDPYDKIMWNNHQYRVGGYVLVNVIGASLFSYTFLKLVFSLPRPFLALTVAFPYLILVVAIGYVRQGIALGFLCYSLVALMENKKLFFVILVLFAASFHKTAVIMLPLLFYTTINNKFLVIVVSAASLFVLILITVAEQANLMVTNYLVHSMQSRGGQLRLAINVIPALVYFRYREKFPFTEIQHKIIAFLAITSLVLFAFVIVAPSFSTALDRLGLYFLPLQLIIFSFLPDLFQGNKKVFMNSSILLFYSLMFFVWIFFADNAYAWLPYENILTLDHSTTEYPVLAFDPVE